MQKFSDLCDFVFISLSRQLQDRNEVGFWSMGRQTAILTPVEVVPAHGAWYAEGQIRSASAVMTAAISVALTPGEARIGLIMPTGLANHIPSAASHSDVTLAISLAMTGKPPNRRAYLPSDRELFDYYLSEDVFSARFMRDALSDPLMADMIAVRLGYLIATLWKSMLDIVCGPDASTSAIYSMSLKEPLTAHALAKASGMTPASIMCQRFSNESQSEGSGEWIAIIESPMGLESMQQVAGRVGGWGVQVEAKTSEAQGF